MLKDLFFPQKKGNETGREREAKLSVPSDKTEIEDPDEDYQLPSLHRGTFTQTAELERRREEEALRKRYGITPSRTGEFL